MSHGTTSSKHLFSEAQHFHHHAGARFCTRENPAKQRGGNAVPGLHSSWVGDWVLACARPWQEYVVKYSLVDAFLNANIGMILNLQEVRVL